MNQNKAHKQPESALSLFSKSSDLVKANLRSFAILYALPLVFGLFQVSNPERSGYDGIWAGGGFRVGVATAAVVATSIIAGLAYIVVLIMLFSLELKVTEMKQPDLSTIWEMTKKYGLRLLGLGITVGFTVIIGLIAFIVPGVIFMRRYFLSPYVLIDQDTSITEAMRRSADLSKPYSGSVWGVIGVTVLIGLVGAFGVIGWMISFVLAALYSVAPALRYRELMKLSKSK